MRQAVLVVSFTCCSVGVLSLPAVAGIVEGEVSLPSGGVEEPPAESLGYVAPLKNPITELRPYDPRPGCFVYLEGAEAETAHSPEATFELGTVSFSLPILPVLSGTTVHVKNVGQRTHAIYAQAGGADARLFEGPPVGPSGVRTAIIRGDAVVVKVLSRDAPHVVGRIVSLPTRAFARMGRDGAFRISDVSPGKYTARVWCMDGWIPTSSPVSVGTGPLPTKVALTLPEHLAPGKK